MKLKELPGAEFFTSGHTACPGCGGAIAIRIAMKIFGKNTVVYNPACCLLVFSGTYPLLAWKVPYHHVLFENTAACITGMKRALKRKGKDDVLVVGIAGDGGTVDIGIQALSGAAERNEDVVYIMYDNEAYMNTGIQRSGATPFGAITTTTPLGTKIAGKKEFKKDMFQIMVAHEIPYVATASLSEMLDYINKLEKIKKIKGCRFLQVLAPCPTGWRFDTSKTIEIADMAVKSGAWSIMEYENGKLTIKRPAKKIPVKDYLATQGRFKHLKPEEIEAFQKWVDMKSAREDKLAEVLK